MRALAGRGTEIVGLDGKTVVAGFHDAHVHLAAGSVARSQIDLRDCRSVEEVAARVSEHAARAPAGSWIRGWGWDHSRWPGGQWPAKGPLDRAAPNRSVFLSRIDGHAAWLSSAGLAEVGLGADAADPAGGTVVREPGSGEPSGIVLERAADLARARVPRESDEERRAAVEQGLERLRRCGVTSIDDVLAPWALPIYAEAKRVGRLTARVSAWLPLEMDRAAAADLRDRFPPDDPWIAVSTLKVFLDGTLGSRTAAMIEPYADAPHTSGGLRVEPDWLQQEVRIADADGWAVAMHAIGDRAAAVAIDALERLPPAPRTRPHRIEHLQVVTVRDLARLAAVGAAASVQPVHHAEDRHWISDRLNLGPSAIVYPWRSLLDHSVTVALGTDWPVAPLDPLRNLIAATTPDRDEALTLRAAWSAYTSGSARAGGRDGDLGSLEPGKLADFVVLSADPAALGVAGLDSLRVLATYLGGRRVFPEV
jgi:predicted amidohydrolase YtcJ